MTHNQRELQRGPAPEQLASDAPAPGGFAGGTGRRKLGTKRFSTEGGKASCRTIGEKSLLPRQPDCPHLPSVHSPRRWNGKRPGCRDRVWGRQVFPSLGPKARRPQQPTPLSPALGYSLLHLNGPVPQGPGTPTSDQTLRPALLLAQRLFHLLTSQFPLLLVLFPSHDALHLSFLTRRPSEALRCLPTAGPVSIGRGHWSSRSGYLRSPPPAQTLDLPVVGAVSDLASRLRPRGSGGLPAPPPPTRPPLAASSGRN